MCRLYRPKRNRPRLAKEVLCRVASNSMLVVLVVTSYMRIRRKHRKNRGKSTPQGRKNSPKSGQDRISQVFTYVIAGSNGFEWVAVLPIGSVRKAAVHDSRTRIFYIFFHIFSPDGPASPFQTERTHTHKKVDSSLVI